MDADWMAIERLYARERADAAAAPHPAARRQPRRRLAEPGLARRRAQGPRVARRGPTSSLCLALVHHVVITANIPLADFIDWLAGLGTAVVIEFVGREDEMVQALLANREDQYDDYTLDSFRSLLADRFADPRRSPAEGRQAHDLLRNPPGPDRDPGNREAPARGCERRAPR